MDKHTENGLATVTGAAPETPLRPGPLSGLRVIELAAIGPGPMCCMLLADLGADVVRIDRLVPSGLGVIVAPRYDVNARGRRSVALDLKHPSGLATLWRLLADADVLIEGYRPGVAEKLGFGPDECFQHNPRLVYGRMTGFGQTGPLAHAAGHDLNYIALTGVLDAIGTAGSGSGAGAASGSGPVPPLNLVGDYGGGALYLAFGVMAALFERQTSGRGQVVDAAMVDGAASLASIFFGLKSSGQWAEGRGQNLLDGGAPFYSTYATADDKHISLAALEPKFFVTLAAALGLEDRFVMRQYDRRLWPEMRLAMAAAVRQRTRDEWSALLEGTDACYAPVLSFDEASQHPHALARAAFVNVQGVVQPAPAPRFGRTPAALPRPAPTDGEHTQEVLLQAGFSAAQIDELIRCGAAR